MLSKVEVTNRQGSLLSLPLDDISEGIIVADIDGLGPVKATIVSSSFANVDGSQYQTSRREDRNLKIQVELDPDYISTSVWDLRSKLYSFFMTKALVSLRFYESSGLTVDISGRVESCEPAIFTDKPAVDISIICNDPDFIDLNQVTLSEMTTAGSTEILIPYPGTVETGSTFVMNIDRALTEFTIYHRPPDGSLRQFDFAAPLVAGDVLTISSIKGNKGVTLTRSSSDSSLLRGKSPQSGWIELDGPGDNYIRVYATGAAIPYTLTFTPRYGGL